MLLALGLLACKPPPDAPAELDELVGYLFEHVSDEDDDALIAGAVNTDAWLSQRLAETLEGYAVNDLSQEAVSVLDDVERDLSGLAGAAVGHASEHSVAALVAASLTDPEAVYPDMYVSYRREEDGDLACFVAGNCDYLEAEVWAEQVYTLGLEVATNSRVQYRWVATPNGPAMIQRTWLRSPADVSFDWLAVDQQYYVWMMLPQSDGTTRSIQATWVVAQFSGDEVPEDLALQLVIGSMSNQSETLDTYVSER